MPIEKRPTVLQHFAGEVEHATGGDPRFVSRLTKETLALVMAGGRGSRLHGLTDWRAKPAVPFAGKFRIIDFTLSNCINSGIRRVGVLTQYKAHSLIRHLQMGWGFLRGEFGEFVELLPAQQRVDGSSWYAGTADAVFQNLDIIRAHAPRQVLILAGDHVYKMDYGRMLARHAETRAQITIGCIEVPLAEASAFGVMAVDETGRVRRFDEKPAHPQAIPHKPDRALASMGIYVFDTSFLLERLRRDAADVESTHDFGKDIIPAAIDSNRVFTCPLREVHQPTREGYWRDVGTLDSYWQANLELAAVTPELNLYDNHWPIWTYQAQLPPAKFVFDDEGQRGMAVQALVSGGCIIAGTARRSVLFSDVRVETGAVVEDSVILPGVSIGSRCAIRRAIVDEGCFLPEGTRIGFDPERDAQRYHISPTGITLVTPEMLGQPHGVR